MAIETKQSEVGKIEANAGFIVIAKRVIPNTQGNSYAVLAMKPNQAEYATWVTDDSLNCYHGHYFTDSQFDVACKDYNVRS